MLDTIVRIGEVIPDWRDCSCVIVAGGASSGLYNYDLIRHKAQVIAINNAYRLVPWADIVYACDAKWWREHTAAQLVQGLKIGSGTGGSWADLVGVQRVTIARATGQFRNDIVTAPADHIGSGGNSGFQALNIAVQAGCRRIALVGYDYCGEHWHGPHAPPLANPRPSIMQTWQRRLEAAAPQLDALGVEVLNCSPYGTMRAFPRADLIEAVGKW